MAIRDLQTTDSRQVAKLFGVAADNAAGWQPHELAAIFRHQLNAPLEFDLKTVDANVETTIQTMTPRIGSPLRTFGDLFCHPHPPLELLRLAKQSAKTHRNNPQSPLPPEIPTVLYFASIVAALAKCGQRITELDDNAPREGIEWALAQPWLDDVTRSLFREGVAPFGKRGDGVKE
jgi:hypothetical protein